jgi:hypothetical protein
MESALIEFLHDNADVFAWKPSNMTGIPCEIVEHCLNIKTDAKLVQWCLRHFNEEKRKAIREELARLLDAGFIREVQHPDWLANPVLVKKKNEK